MTTGRCYCTARLIDGACPYGCPPEADPAWLALQARKRAANDARARREERFAITDAEMRRMRRAMRALDPVTRHVSRRARKAAYRSHAAGARR